MSPTAETSRSQIPLPPLFKISGLEEVSQLSHTGRKTSGLNLKKFQPGRKKSKDSEFRGAERGTAAFPHRSR